MKSLMRQDGMKISLSDDVHDWAKRNASRFFPVILGSPLIAAHSSIANSKLSPGLTYP
jgi:hypothetical protein